MKVKYDVKVVSFEEIHQLPDSWTVEDYKGILEATDFNDWNQLDESELKEYAIMSLQELEPDEAAEVIMKYKFGPRLNPGQIENLAHEMMDERIWEEYTDLRLHKIFYDCAVLMQWAFPNKFPETDAVKCVIDVQVSGKIPAVELTKVFLARLLANGMDDHAIINRLFDEQVGGQPFPEAEGIIWQFEPVADVDKMTITIFSSTYWLHSMDDVNAYTTVLDSN